MSARNERIEEQLSPIAEERPEVQLFLVRQNSEARQWIALMSPDGGRQPPHAASSVAQLREFLFGEFDQAVRRIGADCVNGLRRTGAQPVKAIGVLDAVQASFKYQPDEGLSFNYS
jgi:hypothetical protein